METSYHHRHWVEALFPPTFGYTVEQILDDSTPSEDPQADDQQQYGFTQLGHKISPLDLSAIKNVYQRVWLMNKLGQEEKNRREHEDFDESDFDAHSTYTEGPKSSTPKKQSHKPVLSRSGDHSADTASKIDIQDSCIWSSKEIDVLREVFKSAKVQNARLVALAEELQKRSDSFETKYKKQTKVLESTRKDHAEAKKANSRLQILSGNLKSELDRTHRQILELEDELKFVKEERTQALKETQELRLQVDRERVEKQRFQIDLENVHQEALRDHILREEQLKVDHQRELDSMEAKINDLTKELEEERKSHARSKRGLEHLRRHFASLPLSGVGASVGAVTRDQLRNLTFT